MTALEYAGARLANAVVIYLRDGEISKYALKLAYGEYRLAEKLLAQSRKRPGDPMSPDEISPLSSAEWALVLELRDGDGTYYVAQERAFAPGVAGDWPPVIPKPQSKNGRLVKRQWPRGPQPHQP